MRLERQVEGEGVEGAALGRPFTTSLVEEVAP
jgi:hypothetical protein